MDKFSINLQKWKEETESRSIVSFHRICSVSLLAFYPPKNNFHLGGEVCSALLGLGVFRSSTALNIAVFESFL